MKGTIVRKPTYWFVAAMTVALAASFVWDSVWSPPDGYVLMGVKQGMLTLGFRSSGPPLHDTLVVMIGEVALSNPTIRGYRFLPYFGFESPFHVAGIPLWIPWVIAVVFAVRAWRRRDRPETACASCGYDLQGNRSGRCPECGGAA